MRRRLATVALAWALGPATALSTADERAYRKGMEALDRGRWSDVARFMAEAIEDNPTEGGQVKLYGLRYETYLPHFYLGLALAKLGSCEGAIESLRSSEKQGAVKASPRFADLVDTLSACEARIASRAPSQPAPRVAPSGPDSAVLTRTLRAAEEGLARAEEASRFIAALEQDPVLGPVWAENAALKPASAEARQALEAARARLQAGRQQSDPAQLVEARDLAVQARESFVEVNRSALTIRESLQRSKPAPPFAPPDLPPKAPSPQKPATLPPDLLSAVEAYFAGRYDETLRNLAMPRAAPGRASALAYLFRAAASYALYQSADKKDGALLDQAVKEVRACRRTDPSVIPDLEAFSPRFVEFFRSSR